MMNHVTTSYRTASAERCFVLSFSETANVLAGFTALGSPFANLRQAAASPLVKTWTLTGGVAPPASVPFAPDLI